MRWRPKVVVEEAVQPDKTRAVRSKYAINHSPVLASGLLLSILAFSLLEKSLDVHEKQRYPQNRTIAPASKMIR